MNDIETRIKSIIKRVLLSHLDYTEQQDLIQTIANGVRQVSLPGLITNLDESQLDKLIKSISVSPEDIADTIVHTLVHTPALTQMHTDINEFLSGVEQDLTAAGI